MTHISDEKLEELLEYVKNMRIVYFEDAGVPRRLIQECLAARRMRDAVVDDVDCPQSHYAVIKAYDEIRGTNASRKD